MITTNISKIRDILDKNQYCPFCNSFLSLSADLALTKSHSSFNIENNQIIFNVDPKYFDHAIIDLEKSIFEIEKSKTINPTSLFLNYKSVNFQRTCHFCINNFTLKYSKFKFVENKIESVKIESIYFKLFIKDEKSSLYHITNNFNLEETQVKKLSFIHNSLYEISSNYITSMIDFDFSSIDKIYDKIDSILLFY